MGFIIIIAVIALLLYIGYRIGGHSTRSINSTLYNQVSLLTQFNKHWANEAKDKYQLAEKISQHNATNLASTINTVLNLMTALQKENAHTLSKQDQQAVADIINQAKSISHISEFEK